MIPKIIHYCWFGNASLPRDYASYIATWESMHPGWDIKCWNENNSPTHLPYVQTALEQRNWANVSNYIRLYALQQEGGIYMDTDMKLLKPLDALLHFNCFLGFEEGERDNSVFWVNNAIMGAIPNHPFINSCERYLLDNFDGTEKANLSSPHLATKILVQEYSLKEYGDQLLGDIKLFDKSIFYPVPYDRAFLLKSSEVDHPGSIAMHMWGRSWFSHDMMLEIIDSLQKDSLEQKGRNKKISEDLQNALISVEDLSQQLADISASKEISPGTFKEENVVTFTSFKEMLDNLGDRINKISLKLDGTRKIQDTQTLFFKELDVKNQELLSGLEVNKALLNHCDIKIDQLYEIADSLKGKGNEISFEIQKIAQAVLSNERNKQESEKKILKLEVSLDAQEKELIIFREKLTNSVLQAETTNGLLFDGIRRLEDLVKTVITDTKQRTIEQDKIVADLNTTIVGQQQKIEHYQREYEDNSLWRIFKNRIFKTQK